MVIQACQYKELTIVRIGRATTSFLICILIGFSSNSYSNTQEAKLKAAFVVNFSKFVEWLNKADDNDPLNFCLFGVERYRNVYQTTIEAKAIKGQQPQSFIQAFDAPFEHCNIAYIGPLQDPQRRYLQAQLQSKPILTIGESPTFIKDGGIIRLYAEHGKLRFEINPLAAEASGMKVSSRLLKLASVTQTSKREVAP